MECFSAPETCEHSFGCSIRSTLLRAEDAVREVLDGTTSRHGARAPPAGRLPRNLQADSATGRRPAHGERLVRRPEELSESSRSGTAATSSSASWGPPASASCSAPRSRPRRRWAGLAGRHVLAAAASAGWGCSTVTASTSANLQRQVIHPDGRSGTCPRPRWSGERARELNPDVGSSPYADAGPGERPGDPRRLRPHRRRHRQLPDPLPRQRRRLPARQAAGPRLHLPLRGQVSDFVPGAAATAASIPSRPAGHGPLLPAGGRAGGAAGGDRHNPGGGGDQLLTGLGRRWWDAAAHDTLAMSFARCGCAATTPACSAATSDGARARRLRRASSVVR